MKSVQLQNAYFLAKIGADTAENEQHFAEILLSGRRVADPRRAMSDDVEEEDIKLAPEQCIMLRQIGRD